MQELRIQLLLNMIKYIKCTALFHSLSLTFNGIVNNRFWWIDDLMIENCPACIFVLYLIVMVVLLMHLRLQQLMCSQTRLVLKYACMLRDEKFLVMQKLNRFPILVSQFICAYVFYMFYILSSVCFFINFFILKTL